MSRPVFASKLRRSMVLAGAGSLLFPLHQASAEAWEQPPFETRRPQLDKALDAGARIDALRAVAVARDGQLLARRLHGQAAPDTLFRINSATKSISSMLVGIALAQGKLGNLGQTLGELLPEAAAEQPGSAARDVTLRQVLTGTTGLAYDWTRQFRALTDAADPVQYAFALPRSGPPGSGWTYNDAAVGLIAPILERAYGMPMQEVARQNLFAPLGIEKFEWQRDRARRALAYGGLRLQIQDLAKIAWVMADGGRWHGNSVLPVDWVAESLRAHADGAWPNPPIEHSSYGYLWFTGTCSTIPVAWAWGYGAQFALIAPSLRVVVATAAAEPPPAQLATQNRAVTTFVGRVLEALA